MPPVPLTARQTRPLTRRQRDMLAFIVRHVDEHGVPPTIREIGAAVGVTSTSVANYHLGKLVDRDMIPRGEYISRPTPAPPAGRRAVGAHDPASVLASVLDARAAGEDLPARVVAALEAVA